MRRASILLAIAALAPTAAGAVNGVSAKLQSMSAAERTAMFSRYMATAGKSCGPVTRVVLQGSDITGTDTWNVECTAKTAWSIRLDRKGATRISDCVSAAARGHPCWVTPAPAKAAR